MNRGLTKCARGLWIADKAVWTRADDLVVDHAAVGGGGARVVLGAGVDAAPVVTRVELRAVVVAPAAGNDRRHGDGRGDWN